MITTVGKRLVLSTKIEVGNGLCRSIMVKDWPLTPKGQALAELTEAFLNERLSNAIKEARAFVPEDATQGIKAVPQSTTKRDPAMKGISQIGARYLVHRYVDGHTMYLGSFKTLTEAQECYQASFDVWPKGVTLRESRAQAYQTWLHHQITGGVLGGPPAKY